jgi:DNA-binding PadR family transcriptional regulator
VLEMAVLGLLKEQEMHGYELKRQLADVFGLSGAVSFGSLYPALARLEAAGAVRVVEPLDVGRRRRKVYGITPAGAAMFDQLLMTSQGAADDERAFHLRLAFARYLPAEARLGMLEQRRAVLGERLAHMAARARARRNDHYLRVVADRQQEALRRDVTWLEDLISEERAAAGDGRGPRSAVPPEVGARSVAAGLRAVVRHVPLASASQLQRAFPGPPEGGPARRPAPDVPPAR